MRFRALGLGAITVLVGCSTPAPIFGSSDLISIATDFPTSGEGAAEGRAVDQAVRFAVGQSRGIGRYQLAVRSFDDTLVGEPNAVKGAQNVRRMLGDPSVLAMVGPYNSAIAYEQIPVASAGDLAIVSPSNTGNCLTLALPQCPAAPSAHRGSP